MLTYDIANERLFGAIGNQNIALWARSGGGRGSKIHPDGESGQLGLALWDTQRQEDGAKRIRGGPLPPGAYVVQKPAIHPTLGLSAYLEQTVTSLLYANPSSAIGLSVTNRDGFYIHGRGPKGSDGCVVPMEKFNQLMALLKAHAPVVLRVVNAGARTDKLPPAPPANVA